MGLPQQLQSRHTISAQTRPAREAMPGAPRVQLPDGSQVVPQHYLQYAQTPASISALLEQIHFDQHCLLFCGQDVSSMYIQVGLIGRENYERGNVIRPHKLVYGRKWRIDADTPDAEIVQTALLAIKKAREHEVRELLCLRPAGFATYSAALSNHQDLAVLQAQGESLKARSFSGETEAAETEEVTQSAIRNLLQHLQFGQRPILLKAVEQRSNGDLLVDLQLGQAPLARMHEGDLSEYDELALSIIVSRVEDLVYAVMDALIHHSDRYVEEHFHFDGFARFSRALDPFKIATLSLQTRPYARDMKNARFEQVFRGRNYEVDASRAARLGDGRLAEINRQKIQAFPQLLGHLPADL